MKLIELKQKNEGCIYFSVDNVVLFKIRKYKIPSKCLFLFFDYTFRNARFCSFDNLEDAKNAIKNRFNNYVNKYKKERVENV